MNFIIESTNLNDLSFYEEINYHIIDLFGFHNDYLHRLSFDICGYEFHDVKMIG